MRKEFVQGTRKEAKKECPGYWIDLTPDVAVTYDKDQEQYGAWIYGRQVWGQGFTVELMKGLLI